MTQRRQTKTVRGKTVQVTNNRQPEAMTSCVNHVLSTLKPTTAEIVEFLKYPLV